MGGHILDRHVTTIAIIIILISFSILYAQTDERPNFIIIIGDDIGWNDIGAYGHPYIRTPNIDRLAGEGIRFDNAFLTISSCSPSRCSIMTGRYPHNTGAGELHQPLPADQIIFPALLRKAGYYTVSAGKWHLGDAAKVNFDNITDSRPSGCEDWIHALQTRPKEKPFFMWYAAHDAHRGWSASSGADAIADPHQHTEIIIPPFIPDDPQIRQDWAMYYDEVSRLDAFVGKVIDELDKQDLSENTFILFMSDNGRPFPRCKTTLYDSGIKTPFIIRWPGQAEASTATTSLISAIDIAPTVLQIAGIVIPPTFQGQSFWPILKNPKASIRNYVFAEHNWHDFQAHERSVRSQQYLFIINAFPDLPGIPPADALRSPTYTAMKTLRDLGKLNIQQMGCFLTPRRAMELYDVQKDPYSLENLAYDPVFKDILLEMKHQYDEWVLHTNDKGPENPTPDLFDRETGTRLQTNIK
jgi:arylsulfatase A-like enzyme